MRGPNCLSGMKNVPEKGFHFLQTAPTPPRIRWASDKSRDLNLQNLTLSPSQDCYVWKMGTSEHRFEKMKKNLKNSAGFVKGPRSSGTVILSVNWTFPRKDQEKNSHKKSLHLKYLLALNTAHLLLFATDFLTTDIENHDASGSDKNPLFSCSSWS